MSTKKLVWEKIDDSICRCRVPGGWLVREHFEVAHIGPDLNEYVTTGYDWRATMCFVPDIYGLWLNEEVSGNIETLRDAGFLP